MEEVGHGNAGLPWRGDPLNARQPEQLMTRDLYAAGEQKGSKRTRSPKPSNPKLGDTCKRVAGSRDAMEIHPGPWNGTAALKSETERPAAWLHPAGKEEADSRTAAQK